MSFFKELYYLVKWLFAGSPREATNLEIVKFDYFPFKGYSAMSWCGKIVTRNPERISITVSNHEKIHLMQAKKYQTWIQYYLVYLWQWMKGNPLTSPSASAYYTIPFEMEAYANEEKIEYTDSYSGALLKEKYTIKRRKETFKQIAYKYGRVDTLTWKKYVKTL